jgi:MtN3 and saliva related transmembrane protein
MDRYPDIFTNNSTFIPKFTFQIYIRIMQSYLGFIAAFCTTIAFIPQAVKVYKSKHTKDISLGMFSLLNFGSLLWLWYGLVIISYPIIFANAITIIFALYILITKIRLDVLPSQKNRVNN